MAAARSSPERPALLRHLAEDYVELESAAALPDKSDVEGKSVGQGAVQAQASAKRAEAVVIAARKKAIDYYSLLSIDYPAHGALDEVLYYLAYEYEQADDLRKARAVYYQLIKQRPDSPFIPAAYLAFAELFLDEAQADPSKLDLAVQAYSEVIKYPPPRNRLFGYAWYRLARIFRNKGQMGRSISAFKKAVEFGDTYPQFAGSAKLAESARRDLKPLVELHSGAIDLEEWTRAASACNTELAREDAALDDLRSACSEVDRFLSAHVSSAHAQEAKDLAARAALRIEEESAFFNLPHAVPGCSLTVLSDSLNQVDQAAGRYPESRGASEARSFYVTLLSKLAECGPRVLEECRGATAKTAEDAEKIEEACLDLEDFVTNHSATISSANIRATDVTKAIATGRARAKALRARR